MAGALKDNLVILSDIDQYLGIFFDERFAFDEGAKTILSDQKNRETLQSILNLLENMRRIPEVDHSLLAQLEEKTGRHGKALYAPLGLQPQERPRDRSWSEPSRSLERKESSAVSRWH